MLDKTSRTFLKFVVENEPNMGDKLFTFDYVGNKLGLTKAEAFECIRFLDSQGLLSCLYVDSPGDTGKKELYGFTASHKGRHHSEFARLELYKAVLESVLLPILVSVITALLVTA